MILTLLTDCFQINGFKSTVTEKVAEEWTTEVAFGLSINGSSLQK